MQPDLFASSSPARVVYSAKLGSFDASRSRFRIYELEAAEADDGGYRLTTRRGRVGRPLRAMSTYLPNTEALRDEVARILRLRVSRGYVLVR